MSEKFVSFDPDRQQFDRFLKILQKAEKKGGLTAAMIVVCSMLCCVQSFLIAFFGHDEAKRIVADYLAHGFEKTRPQ